MAQAALNDGLNPVAYAANYGIDLNAASGTPITVWENPPETRCQHQHRREQNRLFSVHVFRCACASEVLLF